MKTKMKAIKKFINRINFEFIKHNRLINLGISVTFIKDCIYIVISMPRYALHFGLNGNYSDLCDFLNTKEWSISLFSWSTGGFYLRISTCPFYFLYFTSTKDYYEFNLLFLSISGYYPSRDFKKMVDFMYGRNNYKKH